MDTKDIRKEVETRFVVLGIRHFENGEHHWLVATRGDAEAFAEEGKVVRDKGWLGDPPAFTSLMDAERYAMSFAHAEYTLAQWEVRRPTLYVVELDAYFDILAQVNYAYPDEAESWSDAKEADFERECDCEDIANLAVWDSDTDKERFGEGALGFARAMNAIDGIHAWVSVETGSDIVAVLDRDNTIEGLRDFVDNYSRELDLKVKSVEFLYAKDGVAYYTVK